MLVRFADPAEKHAALLAGDWIRQIRPVIADDPHLAIDFRIDLRPTALGDAIA